MKQKTFDYKYFVPYSAEIVPPVAPYNLVTLSNSNGRILMSYKRPIYRNKSESNDINKRIGEVNYLIHAHTIITNQNNASGTMRSDFTAHHSFIRNNIEYDIIYNGQVEWILGLRSGQTSIDVANPQNYITGMNEIDTLVVNSILKNGKKINHGNNIVSVKNFGEYRVRGVVERYNFC
jgi:hypothetical protein